LSLSAAGFSATFYIQVGSCLGVVAGGWLADRWTGTNRRGRILTQAMGLAVVGPFLFLAGYTNSVKVLVAGLFLLGLGRGFYDGNTMPALCLVVPQDLRGTAYGLMNLCGALAGGLMAAIAGAVKASVGLGGAIQIVACLVFGSAILLARIRVPRAREMDGGVAFA